ncbi:MAG: hypothetical protein QM490_05630 [Candidatus Gracilibacteria bacterium]
MKGVEIIDLNLVKESNKGPIYEFQNRNSDRMLLIKRKKGTVSGNHYHTGKIKFKNPEIFIIFDGECEIHFINIKSGEEYKDVYKKPVMFKVNPYIVHKITALTDIIIVDMNSFEDDNKDTVKFEK